MLLCKEEDTISATASSHLLPAASYCILFVPHGKEVQKDWLADNFAGNCKVQETQLNHPRDVEKNRIPIINNCNSGRFGLQ